MNPIPSGGQITEHYQKRYLNGNYELIRKYDTEYQAVYNQFLSLVIEHCGAPKNLKLLDVGCFTGRFLDAAKEAGFITYGVEYQDEAANIANKKHEDRIFCGPIEKYPRNSVGQFDVITLFGVIEHVTSPDTTLQIVAELLKPEGVMIIQTPNTKSAISKLLGKLWPAYAPIEHIYYFSYTNIRKILETNGFETIQTIRHWKKLPIAYVYNQFRNFGPEFYRLFSKVMPLISKKVMSWRLPFYGGEMIVVARKI